MRRTQSLLLNEWNTWTDPFSMLRRPDVLFRFWGVTPWELMKMALEILKNGFVPGEGLGVNLDGILEPIQLSKQKSTFGLGYEPTLKEVLSAFVALVTKEDVEEDLMERLKNLFIIEEEEAECNVIMGDCIETLTIWDAEPKDVLNNWTCTASPFL
ncbi:hypothetical protein CQW23_04003 [Capsicum baccatum]|uniref:G-patch domain-containing protein n=1 Tax=Capsicum baccatum TaxID=33114 RepID=A0A2G2XDF1_CAPBA|nr:hypothetical protein CQW23_04003 [Capsicum baccatum]